MARVAAVLCSRHRSFVAMMPSTDTERSVCDAAGADSAALMAVPVPTAACAAGFSVEASSSVAFTAVTRAVVVVGAGGAVVALVVALAVAVVALGVAVGVVVVGAAAALELLVVVGGVDVRALVVCGAMDELVGDVLVTVVLVPVVGVVLAVVLVVVGAAVAVELVVGAAVEVVLVAVGVGVEVVLVLVVGAADVVMLVVVVVGCVGGAEAEVDVVELVSVGVAVDVVALIVDDVVVDVVVVVGGAVVELVVVVELVAAPMKSRIEREGVVIVQSIAWSPDASATPLTSLSPAASVTVNPVKDGDAVLMMKMRAGAFFVTKNSVSNAAEKNSNAVPVFPPVALPAPTRVIVAQFTFTISAVPVDSQPT